MKEMFTLHSLPPLYRSRLPSSFVLSSVLTIPNSEEDRVGVEEWTWNQLLFLSVWLFKIERERENRNEKLNKKTERADVETEWESIKKFSPLNSLLLSPTSFSLLLASFKIYISSPFLSFPLFPFPLLHSFSLLSKTLHSPPICFADHSFLHLIGHLFLHSDSLKFSSSSWTLIFTHKNWERTTVRVSDSEELLSNLILAARGRQLLNDPLGWKWKRFVYSFLSRLSHQTKGSWFQ